MDPDILITDLYELTMLQGYFEAGMDDTAVFEFFVRELPPGRGYLVAAGLQPVLEYLQQTRFHDDDLRWMRHSGRFSDAFVHHLREFRFQGDVHAMAEGTVFFPDEPILRVSAPISQAQLVETRIINLLQFHILAASKAARCVYAAPGKQLVDFGLRRAHGAEAGLIAARASYIAGFAATSNVAAGMQLDIPVSGTMAHSFVQAHDSETQAFVNFARAQPGNVVLLIDTYDTEAAAEQLPEVARQLQQEQISIQAVRIDSGDLDTHARKVRRILDAHGLREVKIFASGGIDEYQLAELSEAGAPVDGFGVGSSLNTSADAPYLDCAYKLVEYAGVPRRKQSEAKATLPGAKQVYRRYDEQGIMIGDTIARAGEDAPQGERIEALLEPVMREGRVLNAPPNLETLREFHSRQIAALPAQLKSLDATDTYPVSVSSALKTLGEETDRYIRNNVRAQAAAAVE